MNVELEETIVRDFITSSPSLGSAQDADLLPTCAVFEDANDTPILTPTVVSRGLAGQYRVSVDCTTANGFEEGKSYNIVLSATVEGITTKMVLASFELALPIIRGVVVADGSNTATTFKTDLTQTTNDHWKDALLVFITGSLVGQVKKITAYNGTTKFVTFTSGFTAAPSASDRFLLVNA